MPNNDSIQIKPLKVKHCSVAGRFHIQEIKTGFISSLGIDFVTALYRAIAKDEK